MSKICDKVINFITKAIENWKIELAARRQTLAEVKMKRDSLLPLVFLIAMMPLNYILIKCTGGAKTLQNHRTRLITLHLWIIFRY